MAAKSKKLGLPQILYEFPNAGQLFVAEECCLAQNLETALSRDDIFDRVAGGLICFFFFFFFFFPLKSF